MSSIHSDDMSNVPSRPILIRRRSSVASNRSEILAQSPTSYGHSSAQIQIMARSPDARERQRTMDVESARLLSRVTGQHRRQHQSTSHLDDEDDEDEHSPLRSVHEETVDILDSLTAAADPDTVNNLNSKPPNYKDLSSQQPYRYKTDFNYAAMEEFATAERRELGLSISHSPKTLRPTASGVTNRFQSPPISEPGFPPMDIEAQQNIESALPRPSRVKQRRFTESNPKPRSRAKSGKLALFESDSGVPSPSLRYEAAGPAVSFEDTVSPFGKHPALHSPHPQRPPPVPLAPHDSHPERPYRFSFYSNSHPATIHSRNICELPADSQSFEELFTGSSSTDGEQTVNPVPSGAATPNQGGSEPSQSQSNKPPSKPGLLNGEVDTSEFPTWWLDILSPSEEEMRMFSKVFHIHPLTTEDILMEETREKIELFRHYYLVCFRGFDQDPYSPTYLEPVNMYIIVFREGILSFHFHATPHPLNVRRRIKQLKDYISVTSDWISYALIDDITDAFGPLIQSIEYEVDSIDELVLILKEAEQSDMLRRIGTCRKKVMGLLRLMGNKADVVKGLAKRCNEQWSVAPKSDIGLYLSDIQDHLITMTQNLNHYEKILSRSHSNYLAQISIEMTDANNKIDDVLSKLTALGTVLIPMNLITGLWGMNVHVPGQDVATGFTWFLSIVGALIGLAACGALVTYRLMSR